MQKNLVKNDNEQSHEESLKEILEHTLEISKNQSLKVSELFNHLGSKGFGVILVFLSLPSALPVPAPGYSTPFGIAIALIAFQILIGRNVLKTPKSIEKIEFQPKLLQKMLSFAIACLGKIEPFIKPRLASISIKAIQTSTRNQPYTNGYINESLPIPLTNTLPAMVICLLGMSLSESDGLLTCISIILSLLH